MSENSRVSIDACPVCTEREQRPWLLASGFVLVRCSACDHHYSTEVYAPEVLSGGYYNEGVTDLEARSLASKSARLREEYRPMLDRAGVRPGRVLDIGCNSGELLVAFQEMGWEVAGVEASEGPARFAGRVVNGPIYQGLVEDVLPAGEKFDLIVSTHVLEHLRSPLGVLRHARRNLKDGGHVLLEVPNANDLLLNWFKGSYRPLCPGDHVSFFTPRSLERLLLNASLAPVETITPTHLRDIVFPGLLSTVDLLANLRPRTTRARSGGVLAQSRYRGRFRAPLRAAVERAIESAEPLVEHFLADHVGDRGAVVICLAECVKA